MPSSVAVTTSSARRRLLLGSAAGILCLVAPQAFAQPAPNVVETVTVTGTNIRGAAPVGEPVIAIDRSAIENSSAVTVQQLLQTSAPQVNGFGSSGQTNGSFEPRIRGIGGSSSAATLVLVDGHRINPGGGIGQIGDPNIVPAGAVQSIEILADGASAVYGSDAVAGVINIHTRKDYAGFELNFQSGFASNYSTLDTGLTFGNAWDTGGVIASYQYTHRDDLLGSDRPSIVTPNHSSTNAFVTTPTPGATGQGGANLNNFNCNPASVVFGGKVWVYPYTTAPSASSSNNGSTNALINGQCSSQAFQDLLPETIAHRLFVSAHQKLGSRVNVSASLIYNNNLQISNASRGSVSGVTVFGPGATAANTGLASFTTGQINPFFVGPPGATSETISYDFNQLYGPGAQSRSIQEGIMGSVGADIDIADGWTGSLTFTVGDPRFVTESYGTVNAATADQALNGSAVSNGNTTTNLIGNSLGVTTTQTRLPLTTANAFNPFAPGATGTSAAVLASLLNDQSIGTTERPIMDFVAKVDGTLFTLPAGDAKVAIGGEYYSAGQVADSTSVSPIGGASQTVGLVGHVVTPTRHILSGFLEFNVPLVSPEMNIPLVEKLTIDVAGRIDHYNDLNSTVATPKTPKVGVSWMPVDDVTVRAAYGTSFVAPFLGFTTLGTTGSTITSYFARGLAQFTLPAGYPNATALGCSATASCTITNASGFDGIQVFGGNPGLKPQTGSEWSAGVDWTPKQFLNGLHASLTYWGVSYKGVITNQSNMTVAAATPGLESVLVINPTAAQIAAAEAGRTTTTALPTKISFISNIVQQNFLNFQAEGADFDIGYIYDAGDLGTFSVDTSGELKTKLVKQFGAGPWQNGLNVVNTTNTFSPTGFTDRTDFGWRGSNWSADFYANIMRDVYATDANLAAITSVTPNIAQAAAGVNCPFNVTPTPCQHISPNITFDMHVAYNFHGSDFWTEGLQVYFDMVNIADKKPPFVDSADGVTPNGSLNGFYNPLGRVVSLGFRKKW